MPTLVPYHLPNWHQEFMQPRFDIVIYPGDDFLARRLVEANNLLVVEYSEDFREAESGTLKHRIGVQVGMNKPTREQDIHVLCAQLEMIDGYVVNGHSLPME